MNWCPVYHVCVQKLTKQDVENVKKTHGKQKSRSVVVVVAILYEFVAAVL